MTKTKKRTPKKAAQGGWKNAKTGESLNEAQLCALRNDIYRFETHHLKRWSSLGYKRPVTKEDMIRMATKVQMMAGRAGISLPDLCQFDGTFLSCLQE